MLAPVCLFVTAAAPGVAAAVPTTCPSTGAAVNTVTVSEPAAGATVGGAVTVKGTAASPTGVSRIELFAGEALKDFQTVDPARNNVDFTLRWEASESPAGPVQLALVVCGGSPARIVQAGTVDVSVRAPEAPPPTPAALTRAPPQDRPATGPPWVAAVFAVGGIGALVAVTSARRHRPAR